MNTTALKLNCIVIWHGEVAIFQSSHVDTDRNVIITFKHGGQVKSDAVKNNNFQHALSCTRHLTVEPDAPKACSWCEAETGIRTQGSHGICSTHFDEQVVQINSLYIQ